jgi:hypothetical protein
MTVNDIDLNAACMTIRAYAAQLELLMRDGRLLALADALATIECEAREAGYITNDLIRPQSELAVVK